MDSQIHNYEIATGWLQSAQLSKEDNFPTYLLLANIAAAYLRILRNPDDTEVVPAERSAIQRYLIEVETWNADIFTLLVQKSQTFAIANSYRQ